MINKVDKREMAKVCKFFKNVLFIFILVLFASQANAGTHLTKGALIKSIANAVSNEDSFVIWVEGGEGNCSVISFPRSAAYTGEAHSRAYATALTAFTTASKVEVYNYQDSDCTKGSQIRLLK